jgi:surface polysaccharide O-acyltransferase-like enzyme
MKTHDCRIDRLRLLACFGVVMLHSSYGSGSGDLMLNAMFRFSVPVFVIISGYFMLSAPRAIGKKSLHLFVRMLLCSAVYMLQGSNLPEKPLAYLLTTPIHLWYLYATMGLYLLTPALMPFVRSAERKEYRYTLILCFILGSCCVTLERLGWFPLLDVILSKSKLPVMLCFTGLYLLGGYFRKFGISNRRAWLAVGILSTTVNVLVCETAQSEKLLSFFGPTVVLAGCAVFALCMGLPDVKERFRGTIQTMSDCTLGVYLFHFLVSDRITPYITLSRQLLDGATTMALRGVCVFAASMAIIWVLRLIPVLRKWML